MFKYPWSACMYNELEVHHGDYWNECSTEATAVSTKRN